MNTLYSAQGIKTYLQNQRVYITQPYLFVSWFTDTNADMQNPLH